MHCMKERLDQAMFAQCDGDGQQGKTDIEKRDFKANKQREIVEKRRHLTERVHSGASPSCSNRAEAALKGCIASKDTRIVRVHEEAGNIAGPNE